MNIFLIKWDYNDESNLAIAQGLDRAGYKTAYWVGASREDASLVSRRAFSHTVFHNVFDAIAGRPAKVFLNEEFAPPDEELIKKLFEAESILSNMKQFEKLNMGSFEKNNLYHEYLEYWLGVINKFKPAAVVFAVCPHSGYDFILYSLAKLLSIKTIVFDYAGISDRHLLINDYKVGSRALRKEIETNKNRSFSLENLAPDIKEFYLNQIDKNKDAITRSFQAYKKQYSGLNLLFLKLKIIVKSLKDLSLFKKIYFYFIKKLRQNYKKEYLDSQSAPDLSKKYIYLALHFQPECSTSPLGGVFVDQILMVKILSRALPDDWLIYIKEHPVQWLAQGINYTSFRYRGYYRKLAKIKKVRLVPAEVLAADLMDKSQAVATITGTAGREAALRRKPVLMFGDAYYRDCPGVFKVNNVASCQNAITKINYGFTAFRRQS